jgi:hypothetical protein
MAEPRVELIGKPNCHLCEEAAAVVERVCAELNVEWVSRSILDEPELADEYYELIPVVRIDGRQHAQWRVDPQRFRAALGGS